MHVQFPLASPNTAGDLTNRVEGCTQILIGHPTSNLWVSQHPQI